VQSLDSFKFSRATSGNTGEVGQTTNENPKDWRYREQKSREMVLHLANSKVGGKSDSNEVISVYRVRMWLPLISRTMQGPRFIPFS
jgi:hypothetical protein